MKKKAIHFILIFTTIVLIISPDRHVDANDEIKLDYWVPFSGTDARPMADMVDKFNKTATGIHVGMKLIEWSQYYKKLEIAFRSNQAPDIAIAHTSKLPDLASMDMIMDINTIAKEAGIDWNDFTEHTLSATINNGKYQAIPLDTHALVMYYNKALLKESGLLDENEKIIMQPGLAGFMNCLIKLKRKLPKNKYPFVSATNNVYPFWIWYAFYSQLDGGGDYIVNGKAAFNNPQARKALKVLIDMRDQGFWPRNINDKRGYNAFKYGLSAISFHGVWAIWNYEQNSRLDFGVSAIPKLFDKPATWGDSHTLIILRQNNKDKQIAAAKFADWLTDHGSLWAVAGHIPSKKAVINSKDFKSMKHRSDYVQVVNQVNFYPRNSKLWLCNDKMVEIFALMMKGEMNAEETIVTAEKEVNKILSN